MAKVKIQGHASGSGVFTVTAPNSNTDRTITLPDGTGTLAFTTGDDDKLPLSGGTMTGDLILGDGIKIEVGSATGGDLQIYHDGSNSYINDTGTGNLNIKGANVNLLSHEGEDHLRCNPNGSVDIYHNNVKKIETTSAGVAVTGSATITASGNGITFDTPSSSQNNWITWKDAGAAKWEIGKNTANRLYFHSYTLGSAPFALEEDGRGVSQFTAKAWVNYKGTNTNAIRDSHNVSSVTDRGTGQYTVNFDVDMANAQYCALTSQTSWGIGNGDNRWSQRVTDVATGSTSIVMTKTYQNGFDYADATHIFLTVFGD